MSACKIAIAEKLWKNIQRKADPDYWGWDIHQARRIKKNLNKELGINMIDYRPYSDRGDYKMIVLKEPFDQWVEREYQRQLEAEKTVDKEFLSSKDVTEITPDPIVEEEVPEKPSVVPQTTPTLPPKLDNNIAGPIYTQLSLFDDEGEPMDMGVVRQSEDYYTIRPSINFEGKTKILNSIGVEKTKHGYFYVLSKEQQDRMIKWRKKSRGKEPGSSKKGFELDSSIDRDVHLRVINGKSYLYVNLKHFVEREGVLLPEEYGYVRIPITLVFHGEREIYLNSLEKEIEYIPQEERELRKYLFKEKGVSAPKSANYYLFEIKKEIVRLIRQEGGEISYDELSNMSEEQVKELISFFNIDEKIKEIADRYKEELETLDEDDFRDNIVNIFIDNYSYQDVEGIWKIVNVLPISFLKLLSFEYHDNAVAFFRGEDGAKNEKIKQLNLKDFLEKNRLIGALATNVAVRNMKEDGLITSEEIAQMNDLIVKDILAYWKNIPEAYRYTQRVPSGIIRKWSRLSSIRRKDEEFQKLFSDFLNYHEKAVNSITEYTIRQNKGLTDVISFISKLGHHRLNTVFTQIALGDFSKTKTNFPVDVPTVLAHELGHSLDFYTFTTKPTIAENTRKFINSLIDMPEFQDYIEKGLESRGYNVYDKKEIIADFYAWVMAKIAKHDVSKGHIVSMDKFFRENITDVERLFRRAFDIELSSPKDVSVEGDEIHDYAPIKMLDFFRELFQSLLDWVNSFFGKKVYSVGREGIKIAPEFDELSTFVNILDRILFKDQNFDIDAILESKVDQTDFFRGGISRDGLFNVPLEGKPDGVNYSLKVVNILSNLTDKQKQEWNKYTKGTITGEQLADRLQIPKEQKGLLVDELQDKSITPEQIALELASKYSYAVEINTAKEKHDSRTGEFDEDGNWISYEESPELNPYNTPNTQYYSNLTVPGGTNYTENEIATPLITPSIKGHAQFSTDFGIGWFRSDDKYPFTGFLEDLIASGTIKKVPCG